MSTPHPPGRGRALLRRALALTATAAVLAGLGTTAGTSALTAYADESGSAVTVPLVGLGEGATLTYSKTKDLVDGETITVTGSYQNNYGDRGPTLQIAQTAARYSKDLQNNQEPLVPTWETADQVLSTPAVADPVRGGKWRSIDVTFTVHQTLTDLRSGETFDGAERELYLGISMASGESRNPDTGGSHAIFFPDGAFTQYVPLTFAGGAAELARYSAVEITQQPANQAVSEGDQVTFSVAASGDPAPSYRWQVSTDNGEGFEDIAGATQATYSTTAKAADDALQYRVWVNNKLGSVVSDPAVLTVAAVDDGRLNYPLKKANSYLKISGNTGLTDGSVIALDTYFQDRTTATPWVFAAQTIDTVGVEGLTTFPESQVVSLVDTPATNAAAKQYFATGDVTVRTSLTRNGVTQDCLTTQCYLAVHGRAVDGSGVQVSATNGRIPLALKATPNATADYNTVYIPLYFEGGTLTPEPWIAPSVTAQPQASTVTTGYRATFEATVEGSATIEYRWERSADGGETWTTVRNATTTTYQVTGASENNGSLYRLRARNNGGTVYSEPALLTVEGASGNYDDPNADLSRQGISLDWFGNQELQDRAPNYSPNYFSAGISEGTKSTYQNAAGNVVIGYRDNASGDESVQTYAQYARSNAGNGRQFVRLNNGTVSPREQGGSISWDADWSVNFYGGLVPFTLSDPTLTWNADGEGTLTADLSGWGSSMDDPSVKVKLDPVADQTIATFSSVRLATDGTLSLVPDYNGVTIDIPEEETQQVLGAEHSGSWPQQFVDFQFKTGLSSYWYSSGGSTDHKKAPYAITVAGLAGTGVNAPVLVPEAPASVALKSDKDGELTVDWSTPNDGGAAISGYTVALTGAAEDSAQVAGDATSHTFTGLATGEYTVTVTATNSAGESEGSAPATLAVTGAGTTPSTPAASTVTVSAKGATFGKAASVSVTVKSAGKPATGKVSIAVAGKSVTRTLVSGKTTLALPTTLSVTKHTVKVAYAGNSSTKASTRSTSVTVSKASTTARVALSAKSATAGRTRLKATVTVKVPGTSVAATGKAQIRVKGKVVRTVTVKNGKASVRLPAIAKRGTATVTVKYRGTASLKADTSNSVKVKVRG